MLVVVVVIHYCCILGALHRRYKYTQTLLGGDDQDLFLMRPETL